MPALHPRRFHRQVRLRPGCSSKFQMCGSDPFISLCRDSSVSLSWFSARPVRVPRRLFPRPPFFFQERRAAAIDQGSSLFLLTARRRSPATPGSGARNVFSAAARAAALATREIPREEIPPCPRANSSARGSPPAVETLHLPIGRHTSTAADFGIVPTWLGVRGSALVSRQPRPCSANERQDQIHEEKNQSKQKTQDSKQPGNDNPS